MKPITFNQEEIAQETIYKLQGKVSVFDLQPHGSFQFIWTKNNPGRKTSDVQIYIGEMGIKHESPANRPYTKKTERYILRMMKEFKTDVLTAYGKFFTRTGNGITEIFHNSFVEKTIS